MIRPVDQFYTNMAEVIAAEGNRTGALCAKGNTPFSLWRGSDEREKRGC